MKSNNQGLKEATFIRISRRGADVEINREVLSLVWHREVAVEEWAVPWSRELDKNWEGYLRSEQSQPQARLHSPGFQHQEDKYLSLLAVKTSGGWRSRRYCGILRRLHLKGPHRLKMYADPAPLGFSTR